MNRRGLLRTSVIGLVAGLAGCQRSGRNHSTTTKKRPKSIGISPTVKKIPGGWSLKVTVTNEDDWDASFHDVQLLAYTTNGIKTCEAKIGNLTSSSGFQRTVETTCSAFPAIITTTAEETPCENALIPVLRWTGTDAQRRQTVAHDEWPWSSTYRKCGEELPPERVIKRSVNGYKRPGDGSRYESYSRANADQKFPNE